MDSSRRLSYLRIRQLRLVAWLGRGLTLSAAAERLAISAPAASLMLQEIESLLGIRLFERDRRGVRPTGPGKIFAAHVAVLLHDFANMENDVDEIKRSQTTLHLGAIPQALIQFVPPIAMHYKGRNLGLLKVTEGTSSALLSRVQEGELNAAILRLGTEARITAEAQDLRFDVLANEEFAVVVGVSHTWSRRRRIAPAELAELDWVLPSPESQARIVVERYFVSNGLGKPRMVLAVDSTVQSLLCAETAGCAAAGPLSVVNQFASSFSLKKLPISIAEQHLSVGLVYRAAQFEMPTFCALREIALKVSDRLGAIAPPRKLNHRAPPRR